MFEKSEVYDPKHRAETTRRDKYMSEDARYKLVNFLIDSSGVLAVVGIGLVSFPSDLTAQDPPKFESRQAPGTMASDLYIKIMQTKQQPFHVGEYYAPTENVDPDVFKDMVALSVKDPGDNQERYSSDLLKLEFDKALGRAATGVDGAFEVPKNLKVVEIDYMPTGKQNGLYTKSPKVACYTPTDVANIRAQAVAETGRSVDAPMPLVLNTEAYLCNASGVRNERRSAAFVNYRKNHGDFGVYYLASINLQDMDKQHNDSNVSQFSDNDADRVAVKIHETAGHGLGLPHGYGVEIFGKKKDKVDYSISTASGLDIAALTHPIHGILEPVKNTDGKTRTLDEYAGSGTAMGNLVLPNIGDPFNFFEQNLINHDNARLLQVDNRQSSYIISTRNGADSMRGIVFELPEDHALSYLLGKDKKMSKIALGINSTYGDDSSQIALIGKLDDPYGNTVTFGNYSTFIRNINEPHVIYSDRRLGVEVTARRSISPDAEQYGEVILDVRPIEQSDKITELGDDITESTYPLIDNRFEAHKDMFVPYITEGKR